MRANQVELCSSVLSISSDFHPLRCDLLIDHNCLKVHFFEHWAFEGDLPAVFAGIPLLGLVRLPANEREVLIDPRQETPEKEVP